MIRASILFIALASLASTTGCKKSDKDGGGSAKATEAKATTLPKLGLQLDVPGTVNLDDAIGGEGHMLMGASVGAMTVEVYEKPLTLDEEKAEADMYSPRNLKGEALADGWAVTFDNKGDMGASFFVSVRRDIGGKSYRCSTTTNEAGRQAAVLAACKSLRK